MNKLNAFPIIIICIVSHVLFGCDTTKTPAAPAVSSSSSSSSSLSSLSSSSDDVSEGEDIPRDETLNGFITDFHQIENDYYSATDDMDEICMSDYCIQARETLGALKRDYIEYIQEADLVNSYTTEKNFDIIEMSDTMIVYEKIYRDCWEGEQYTSTERHYQYYTVQGDTLVFDSLLIINFEDNETEFEPQIFAYTGNSNSIFGEWNFNSQYTEELQTIQDGYSWRDTVPTGVRMSFSLSINEDVLTKIEMHEYNCISDVELRYHRGYTALDCNTIVRDTNNLIQKITWDVGDESTTETEVITYKDIQCSKKFVTNYKYNDMDCSYDHSEFDECYTELGKLYCGDHPEDESWCEFFCDTQGEGTAVCG